MPIPPAPAHPPELPSPGGRRIGALFVHLVSSRPLMVAALLLVTVAVVSFLNPAFASIQNLRDLLIQAAPAIIVACGMTFVVLTGEIDISVGSLMGLLAALLGILASPSRLGLSPPMVVGVVLLAGTGCGLLNGLLVTLGRVPSIIATLGMLTILRGVTVGVLGGVWVTDLPPAIRSLGTGALLGIPFCIWAAVIVAGASLLLLHRTPSGLRIRAVGGNPRAAAIAGLSTTRVKLLAFALLGALTAIATLFSVPQQSTIESDIGLGFELVVITAVVVGGTSIRGGRGGIAGTLLAACLLGSIRTVLAFLNLGEMATYWERAIQGAFILAAVLSDHLAASKTHADEAAGEPA